MERAYRGKGPGEERNAKRVLGRRAGEEDPWEKLEWGRALQGPTVEEFIPLPGESPLSAPTWPLSPP
jgi:hypothetical protein